MRPGGGGREKGKEMEGGDGERRGDRERDRDCQANNTVEGEAGRKD